MACVLVTGGAGYIGSHTCVALLEAGHEVVVVDNLCNASAEALRRVEYVSKKNLLAFHELDVCDEPALAGVFRSYPIDSVVHFAAFKSVSDSVRRPLDYYRNNVGGTMALVRVMEGAGVFRLVFSSSATVYGNPIAVPVREDSPTAPTNPYGWSKWMAERVLQDVVVATPRWSMVALRYFNPVGAHPSGLMGEDPIGIPDNLLPYVSQVAIGRLPELRIFGNDYSTSDGTGVRDYIHVMDLAAGHLRAIERLDETQGHLACLNLGAGRGYSVLEVVRAFEIASGQRIPFRFAERRAGDIAECWADPSSAERALGWRAEHGLEAMCADTWRWQSNNPQGYASA